MRLVSCTVFLLALVTCSTPSSKMPNTATARLPLIVDADTANELDDLFALVRAVAEPSFDLRGITSAQFHTSPLASDNTVHESQDINEDLLRLLDREDIPHPIGANTPLSDRTTPSPSPAAEFIVQQALRQPAGQKLHLVILGSCTNVASAILLDPRIIPRVSVHYLGFWHDPATNDYNKQEFNSGNDTLAVEVLLDTEGLELDVMTATTSQHLVFNREETERQLKSKGPLAEYLLNRWDTYTRWWTAEDPEKTQWIMWDVAIIEALARPKLATKLGYPTPPENALREIGIYTAIDVPAMKNDFWQHYPE
ncbi:nucleoside hydrolase [Neolewinella sp.]|uniref:nucleoside hydrolase n=1 Tax=Neolewinella sp. TaxID=2993543 RepID=UPI003B52BA0F